MVTSEELETYPPPASFVVQGEIHDQSQSPLFRDIPPEIRNAIFEFALTEYVPKGREWTNLIKAENTATRSRKVDLAKRPGYEGMKTVDTDLLRTCKKIYEESKLLPLQDLEICFYVSEMTGGDNVPEPYIFSKTRLEVSLTFVHPRVKKWFKPEHWHRIKHYQIFGKMYLLETGFRRFSEREKYRPISMTLTLRYTDWMGWRDNRPIYPLEGHHFIPMPRMQLPSTVQVITVEFESIEPKLEELKAVVQEMFTRKDIWFWKRYDGRVLRVLGEGTEGVGIRTWSWAGPTRFGREGDQRYAHHGEGDTMEYVVKAVTWELDNASECVALDAF